MSTTPPPPGEPCARGSVLHGFRAAAVDLWGNTGLDQVATRLPLSTRLATIEQIVLPFEWVPIEHVVAWHDALWAGPARADEQELARFIGRSIELGLGRFKSAFFSGITPERLIERSQDLWRSQHTHGDLTVAVEGTNGTVVLRNHAYVEHASSRRVTAESYRYIVTMAGGRDVTAAWGPAAGQASSLVVQLSWRA
jgi:hypothetical protein